MFVNFPEPRSIQNNSSVRYFGRDLTNNAFVNTQTYSYSSTPYHLNTNEAPIQKPMLISRQVMHRRINSFKIDGSIAQIVDGIKNDENREPNKKVVIEGFPNSTGYMTGHTREICRPNKLLKREFSLNGEIIKPQLPVKRIQNFSSLQKYFCQRKPYKSKNKPLETQGYSCGMRDDRKLYIPQVWEHMMKNKVEQILKFKGKNLVISESFNSSSPDITDKMRHILIDWLVDVHHRFKLRTETLFLAINLVDRTTSCTNIEKKEYQLLGITAMFLSSKYEEIYPPNISEFVYVCADTYFADEIKKMEGRILNAIEFNLVFSSSYSMFSLYAEEGIIIS